MQLDCTSPATILSPHIRENILRYGNYYIDDVRNDVPTSWYDTFPKMKFRTIMKRSSIDDFDSCYVQDFDANKLPIFMAVPCGKCECCKDKKAREWACRAMCESQCSNAIPYFVTLTYNDSCLPKNGVRKGSCQRFMKRLRINYERLTGCVSQIRYFICAEYGSKTKRPHYHALLWNLDILNADEIVDLIQRSWSFAVSKKYYNKVSDAVDVYGKPIYKYMDGKTPRCMYGYIKVSPVTEGRVRYCMKYMRKDAEIPRGCKNVFFLSSRRGGIGRDWLEHKLKEFRDNPSILNVELVDKWSGKTFRGVIPTYFKNIIAPPPSRIIDKDIRDAFAEYDTLYRTICREFTYVNSFHDRVVAHYPTLYHTPSQRIRKPMTSVYSEMIASFIARCDELEYYLLSYTYSIGLAKFSPKYKLAHSACASEVMKTIDVNPKDHAFQLRLRRSRLIHNELF